jgi:oligoendopeptidase F
MTESKQHSLPKREDIESIYKWKLEDMYESIEKWEEDFLKVKLLSDNMSVFKGHLEESGSLTVE